MLYVFSVVMLSVDTIVGLVLTYSLSALVFTSNPALIPPDLHVVRGAS